MKMESEVKFNRLNEDAVEPKCATPNSAGCDLCAVDEVEIMPGETKLVRTGLAMAIPAGMVGLLFPRSGISLRTPLRLANSVGVIDSDYRGEVCAMFTNTGDDRIVIERGMRMAQIVIVPYCFPKWVHSKCLDETERGSGGFGHTGV